MASVIYNRGIYLQMTGQVNLSTDGIRCALCSSGYTPDKDDTKWAAGVGPKDNEITGTGYTENGVVLGNRTLSLVAASDNVKYDTSNAVWTEATFIARHAIIYVSNATLSNPLITCYDFGTNKQCTAGTFSIAFNAGGLFTAAQS